MDTTYVGFPITKTETLQDGTRMVWGPATTDDLDSDKQIIDPEFATKGLAEWLRTGANVREMHQPKAIGKGVELVTEGTKQMLTGHIVAKDACDLVDAGILQAWSVGINDAKILKGPGHPLNGRIVGGTFVEVSLVDRPANAACKVQVVTKAADSTDAVFTDAVTKFHSAGGAIAAAVTAAACATCNDTGLVKGQACPDCEVDGVAKIETIEDVGFVGKKKLSTEARNSLKDSDFVFPEDRRYPIHDESHARNALARASGKPEESKVRAAVHARYPDIDIDKVMAEVEVEKKGKPGMDPDDTNPASDNDGDADDADDDDADDKKAVAPFTLKRLHDFTCAAFSREAVKDTYPGISSFSDVLAPEYFAKSLSEAAMATLADTTKASDLAGLSTAYGDVLALTQVDEEDIDACRDDLHKMFCDAYPSVSLSPGSVTPGQFKRPFVGSGRAQMHATGKPRIPTASGNVGPENFMRGPLTDGQQRPSPQAGPAHHKPTGAAMSVKAEDITVVKSRTVFQDNTIETFVASYGEHTATGDTEKQAAKRLMKKLAKLPAGDVEKERNFYTNNARDQARMVMETVHDYIQAAHPSVCPMTGPHTHDPSALSGGDVVATSLDNRQDSTLVGTAGAVGKTATLDYTNGSVTISGPTGNSTSGTLVFTPPSDDTETVKAIRKLQKSQKRLERELKAAQEENAELAKMADPTLTPLRGMRGALPLPTSTKAEAAEAQVDPAEAERAEELDWLKRTVKFGSPDEKDGAINKLRSICGPEELGQILVST